MFGWLDHSRCKKAVRHYHKKKMVKKVSRKAK
jgi:hypothetical protein